MAIPNVAFLDTHFAKGKARIQRQPGIVGPSTLEKIHEVLQPQPYQGDGASPKMTDAELLDRLELVGIPAHSAHPRSTDRQDLGKAPRKPGGLCVPFLMKKLVSGQFEKPPSRGGIRSRTPFAWSITSELSGLNREPGQRAPTRPDPQGGPTPAAKGVCGLTAMMPRDHHSRWGRHEDGCDGPVRPYPKLEAEAGLTHLPRQGRWHLHQRGGHRGSGFPVPARALGRGHAGVLLTSDLPAWRCS